MIALLDTSDAPAYDANQKHHVAETTPQTNYLDTHNRRDAGFIMNDQVPRREPDDTSYNTLIRLLRREIVNLQNQLAVERERANALEYELLRRIAAPADDAGKPADVPDLVVRHTDESVDAIVELPLWTLKPSAKERLQCWWRRQRIGNRQT